MRTSTVFTVVMVVVGCKSDKQDRAIEPAATAPPPTTAVAPGTAPAAPATTGSAAAMAPEAGASDTPKTAPAITVDDLSKKLLEPFVDAKRGVWVVGKKTTQLCGAAVSKALPGWTKSLERAVATSQAAKAGVLGSSSLHHRLDCETEGDRATCTAAGLPDPGQSLEEYRFIFVAGPNGSPVLASVVTGPSSSKDAPVTSCPEK